VTSSLVVPRLAAGPYLLRAFESGDLSLVEEAAADPYIPLVTTVPYPFTHAAGLAFIARQHARAHDGAGYSMVIVDRAGDRAVGSIGLWLRDVAAGRAAVGYWMVPSARGRGAAAHALTAVARWALEDLVIPRVELFVEPDNAASIRTAERSGFVREGVLRRWQEIDGIRRDMVVFSRLAQ
jgi:[ribosomal protein S5]-alanine N-acetyltransferase